MHDNIKYKSMKYETKNSKLIFYEQNKVNQR
jgi:hypothetical protein